MTGEGSGGAIDQRLLFAGRFIDLGMAVSQQVGAVTAHEIDIFVAVGIPQATSLCTGEKLRVVG